MVDIPLSKRFYTSWVIAGILPSTVGIHKPPRLFFMDLGKLHWIFHKKFTQTSHKKPKNLKKYKVHSVCAFPWPQFLHIIFQLNTFFSKKQVCVTSTRKRRTSSIPYVFFNNEKRNIEPFPKKKKKHVGLVCFGLPPSVPEHLRLRRWWEAPITTFVEEHDFGRVLGVARNPVRYSKRFDKTMHILNLFEENGWKKKSMLFGVYAGIILWVQKTSDKFKSPTKNCFKERLQENVSPPTPMLNKKNKRSRNNGHQKKKEKKCHKVCPPVPVISTSTGGSITPLLRSFHVTPSKNDRLPGPTKPMKSMKTEEDGRQKASWIDDIWHID